MTPDPVHWALREAGTSDIGFLRQMLHKALYVHDGDEPFPESILDEPQFSHYFESFGAAQGDLWRCGSRR